MKGEVAWQKPQHQGFASSSETLPCAWHFAGGWRGVEGLSFFFFFILPSVSKAKAFFMVSMEKEMEEPMLRENLKAMPWLVNVWHKSRHLMAKVR